MSEVKVGTLLVANAEILAGDPFFAQSVILVLCSDELAGICGVNIAAAQSENKLYNSGPMSLPIPLVLQKASPDTPEIAARSLGKIADSGYEVAAIFSREEFEATVSEDGKMVLIGYAGWSHLQLEDEMAIGAWAISPATLETVLQAPPAERYNVASQGTTFATEAPV